MQKRISMFKQEICIDLHFNNFILHFSLPKSQETTPVFQENTLLPQNFTEEAGQLE